MPGPDGWDEGADGDVPFRPMSISEMLDGAIAGIRRRPRITLGLSVAVSTVIQVLVTVATYYFIGDQADGEVTPGALLESVGSQLILGAIGLALSAYGILLLSGLLAPLLGRGLLGTPVPPRQAWRDVRPRLGRLIAVAALIMVVSLLALLLPIVPFLLLVAAGAHPALDVLAAVAGFPVGVGLMVWLYMLLVLAAPAVVMERETVGGAFRRARALSRGRWLRTCGTLLLTLLITLFMGFFALRIPFLIVQLVFFGDASHGTAMVLGLAVDTVGRIVSWSIMLPFDAGVIALLYVDRRMRREGFDLELRSRGRSAAAIIAAASPAASAPADSAGATAGRGRSGDDDPDGFFDLWRPYAAAAPGALAPAAVPPPSNAPRTGVTS
ncbi:hypothetical protein [Spirillospora sp. NBC_01491]|uniref:hypothetical protein n=1 Tax=Spirillospora sp. NBC_01491 TaxID=2976007 RepID=UPI002E381335|nr:hypothetical protein [Spirillospora sp. NBC_01491]